MTTLTAPMKKAGHLRQQVPAVVPIPGEDSNMTSIAQHTDTVHYPWCDESSCRELEDYRGAGEPGVLHRSEEASLEGKHGELVTARITRFRATWSETEGGIDLDFRGLEIVSLDDVDSLAQWLMDVNMWAVRAVTIKPQSAPCPEWCTAAESVDERIRDAHEWRFVRRGMYGRAHHGPVGKSHTEQWEWSEPDGSTRLGWKRRGPRPHHRELRDGLWYDLGVAK